MRILFCIENDDQWILNAYKDLYLSLQKHQYIEMFCTMNNVNDASLTGAFNIIDYQNVECHLLHGYDFKHALIKNHETVRNAKNAKISCSESSLIKHIFMFKTAFSLIEPDLVIVWNGMCDFRKMVADFVKTKNVPVLYAEKGMLPKSWYIDKQGINATSSIGLSLIGSLKYKQSDLKTINGDLKYIEHKGISVWGQPKRCTDKNEIRAKLGIRNINPIVFFPAQLDEDTNIQLYSRFNSVPEAIEEILASISENVNLVIKLHPKSKESSKESINELVKKSPNVYVVEDINVWDLLDVADLVVTINSTVAFETLIKNKNIIVLGDSVLVNVGLVEKTAKKDLSQKIKCLIKSSFDEQIDVTKLHAFIKYLLDEYYIFNQDTCSRYHSLIQSYDSAQSIRKSFNKDELWSMFYPQNRLPLSQIYGRKVLMQEIVNSYRSQNRGRTS